jgi:thiol-disulfide isomerase/thioredoxin
MPILRFHPAADEDGTSNVEWGKSPVLITLWVSWCPTCLAELDMLSKQAATWRQLGVRVLTLCVDRLDADHGDNLTAARHVWEGLDPYLDCGFATAELVDKLRIVQRIVLNQQPAEVVPVSYLIDQRGELSVLYRGPVDMKTLRQDVDMLDVNSDRRRALAVPFHGLWTTPPGNLLLRPVAQLFREHGYQEDHDRIAQLELIRLARLRESVNANEANQLNRQFAIECFNLAHSLQSQEQIDASIEYYQQGLAVWDQSAEAHYHLARALKAKMAATSAAEH